MKKRKSSPNLARLGRGILVFSLLSAAVLVLFSAQAPLAAADPDPDWLSGWDYRIELTIDHTDIDIDLDNFPVLIYLSSSSGRTPTDVSCVFDELTSANRQKIAVTTSDGTTQCYVEIENWNDAAKNAWLWVKVPFIDNDTDTILYLYYDSSQENNTTYVGDPSDAVVHNVWDASHKLVTHMCDDPDTSHVRDSTVNANDGTKKAAGEPAVTTAGKIDDAQDFDGTNDYVRGGAISTSFPLTWVCWFKSDVAFTANRNLINQGGNPGAGGINPNAYIQSNAKLRFYTYSTSVEVEIVSSVTFSANTWYNIAIVVDSNGNPKLYVGGDYDSGASYKSGSFGQALSNFYIGANEAFSGGYFNGIIDEVRISNTARSAAWIKASYESGRDDLIAYGSEETSGAKVFVTNIACDNCLLDRDVDWATSGVVTATKLQADVEFETGKLVVKENIYFEIRDAANALVDNLTATENLKLTDNKQRFFVMYSTLDNTLADGTLGGWDVKVGATDNAGNFDDSSRLNLFYVADLDATSNVENLIKHRIWTYGTVSRISGETLTGLENVIIEDNEMGTLHGVLSGNDWENVRAPAIGGQFRCKLKSENLDGITDNFAYEFPNFAPEIIYYASSETLVDRDEDYTGSGAILTTDLTVRARDNDNYSDLSSARILVRDASDVLIENTDAWTTATVIDENTLEFTLTHNPPDGADNLGGWDAGGEATDIYGGSASSWDAVTFTVDDYLSTINFNPTNPIVGWNLNVSGTHSRVTGGAVSVDASWLIDNQHGQFALGAANTYDKTYTISNAGLEENVSVTLRVLDLPLDGATVSSYKTSDNVKFQVWVCFEDNYELVQWVPDENRPLEIKFVWEGGTQDNTLSSNPENIVVATEGVTTKYIKIDDNDKYWRYAVPDLPGGDITFVIVDDFEEVEQYRFFLQDYTGSYGPPNGQLIFKLWIGDTLAEINGDYWGADWRSTAWLVTGEQYQIWVRTADAPLRLVGPIDAVGPEDEKTIIVQVVIADITSILDEVGWAAWREGDNIVRAEYKDNLDNTVEAHVGIYDMDGNLMSEYQPDNEWFIATWVSANPLESYNVVLTIQHGVYGDFILTTPIGFAEGPPGVEGGVGDPFGLPSGLTLAALGSVVLVIVIALAFDALRVQLGVLAMALATLFFWYMGFLPLPGPYGGAYTAVLILVMAVLFALTWRRGR